MCRRSDGDYPESADPVGQPRGAANEEEPDVLADELEAMLDIPDAERDLPDMAMSAENKRVI